MCLPLERDVRGSNLGPVKSDTVFTTARHCCNISSKGAGCCIASWLQDTKMGPRKLVAALVDEYNESFDLK